MKTTLALCLSAFTLPVATATASGQDPPPTARGRSAEAIVADFDAVTYPSMSEGSDPAAVARFERAIGDASHRQEALAQELLAAHPEHARVPELTRMRWQLLVNVDRDFARVRKETSRWIDDGPDAQAAPDANRTRLAPLAHVLRAWAGVDDDSLPVATRIADVESALAHAPADFLAHMAALQFAQRKSCDPAYQRAIAKRVAALDPDAKGMGGDAGKLATLVDRVGKSPEADFVEATSQRPFRLDALRGHPVLVTFFPTPWSKREPIEAAALKSLAREFAAQGLELVVVHEVYDPAEIADRRRHLEELALPGRAHIDCAGGGKTSRQQLIGVELPEVSLLLDRQGRVTAVCGEAATLRGAIARACAPTRKRRDI